MKKPELLAPGGSFLGAHAAFAAGADGVYLGLKEFSARKAAQNFSMDQLRRIRQLAADKGRKVYVAVNTVVREGELDRLFATFCWLAALAVDGVIVQDLGVYGLLRKEFPGLPIHASTQMAVHNDAGMRAAEEMGIRRVILSRELTLEHIRELRQRHHGIELEVFIHGALCYSFSGACLASSALTGRSANRGDCAQICRSLFHAEAGERGRLQGPAGHCFSARDLFLGREVLALADIGIDALKIEGRMKSPEYAYNVTRLYREILDRGRDLPEEEYAELVRRADLGFAREKTTGWLHGSAGSRLIDRRYPGHRGTRLGTVESARAGEMRIRLGADLSLRDGLGFFPEGDGEPLIFSVSRIMKAGREKKFARAGETVSVEVAAGKASAPGGVAEGGRARNGVRAERVLPYGARLPGQKLPPPGAEIRHLSSRFLDLPMPKEAGFPLYRVPLDMRVGLSSAARDGERRSGVLSVRIAGYPVFEQVVTVDAASRKRPFVEILARMLGESGDSVFMPGNLSFANETGLADDAVFVPPSQLKKAKNELYAFLDEAFLSSCRPPAAPPELTPLRDAESIISPDDLALLAHRQAMAPRQEPGDSAPVPFVAVDPGRIDPRELFLHAGYRWLPLPPVLLDDGLWVEALPRLAERHPDTRFAIGLNNISHIAIASALGGRRNLSFFVDFYLYVANCRALSFISERVPRLLFAYAWIEGGRGQEVELGCGASPAPPGEGPRKVPLVALAPDFRPPLFYSLGCFARHVPGAGACLGRPSAVREYPFGANAVPGEADWMPLRTKSALSGQSGTPHLANSARSGSPGYDDCPRDFAWELRQGRNRFQVVVRDCVTYLFARGKG
jgi:putative protease